MLLHVVFGGSAQAGVPPLVSWTQAPAQSGYPSLLTYHPLLQPNLASCYDRAHRRMLLRTEYFIHRLDLVGDGGWTRKSLRGTSYARGNVAFLDESSGRMITFGGREDHWFPSNRLETIDVDTGAVDTLETQGQPPSPRFSSAGAYDSIHRRLFVFGGRDPITGDLGDLWQVDLTTNPVTWSTVSAVGIPPGPREGAVAIYDPVENRVIFHGGNLGGNPNGELWQLDLDGTPTWSELPAAGTPPTPRSFHGAVYDSANHSMILCGGLTGGVSSNEIWTLSLDAPPTWTQTIAGNGVMPPRHSAAAVLDPVLHRLVVHGGRDEAAYVTIGDTPVLALASPPYVWHFETTSPPPRHGASTVYDPIHDCVWMFGGRVDAGYPQEPDGLVWKLDFATAPRWAPVRFAGSRPAQRAYHQAFFDPIRSRMVMMGGWKGRGEPADEFLLDPWVIPLNVQPGWFPLVTHGTPPPPRGAFVAVHDSRRDRMLIIGGNNQGVVLGDVWELPFSTLTWHQIVPLGTPPVGRSAHSGIYDAANDRVVIHGGYGVGDIPIRHGPPRSDSVWELALSPEPAWRQLAPAPERGFHTLIQNAQTGGLVAFGGNLEIPETPWTKAQFNDLWIAPPNDPLQWTELLPSPGPAPLPRFGHAATCDSRRNRMVMFGGAVYDNPSFRDTWFLNFEDAPTPVLPSIADWSATPTLVRIVWYAAQYPGEVSIVRSNDRGSAELDRASFDGTGRIVFEDSTVSPGERFTYALRSPTGEEIASIRIEVPDAARAVLAGFSPNPGDRQARVRFTLPDSRPARLTVVDVTGRVVWSSDVASLGAGSHSVAVGSARGLPPGVYSVRLSSAGSIQARRGVIVR